MRQQFLDLPHGMRRDACEHISEVLERINPVELRRLDQAHDRRRALTRSKRSVNALLSIRPWLGTLLDS